MGEREKATLIYLEDCMLLSRKNYASWKEVQLSLIHISEPTRRS